MRKQPTPSSKVPPPVVITRRGGDQHSWSRADRDTYSGVKPWWNNIKTGRRSSVIAGLSGRAKELRTTFASEADALAAARAEWLRIQRGIFDFEITLAYGRADITPQRPARVAGYKRKIDETPWIVASVRHTLDGSGYVSQLTLETEQAKGVEGQEGANLEANARPGVPRPIRRRRDPNLKRRIHEREPSMIWRFRPGMPPTLWSPSSLRRPTSIADSSRDRFGVASYRPYNRPSPKHFHGALRLLGAAKYRHSPNEKRALRRVSAC
ncbi:hypothetical protein ACSFBF_10285 [Variovorax sp. ZT5P49]|uniref:hypothetical protein n=1 Tax=Variovorax sp. ZT5P49 TaxID=3443733 RepID=UPI003F461D27